MKVDIFTLPQQRAKITMGGMDRGIRASGDIVMHRDLAEYDKPRGDVAVFYGLKGGLLQIMQDYLALGRHTVFVDLGYWQRTEPGRFIGHHKITIDGVQPQPEQLDNPDPKRFRSMRLPVFENYRPSRVVLLAGMSEKSAWVYGLKANEWELRMIEEIRKHSGRKIVYRPKPSWDDARPLPGTYFSGPKANLTDVFRATHFIVTHHSNVAIDGAMHGIPSYSEEGAARVLSCPLSCMENPPYPTPQARQEFFQCLAWWQWNVNEMMLGLPWKYYKQRGYLS